MRIHECIFLLLSSFLPLSKSKVNDYVGGPLQEDDNNIINLRRRHTSTSFQSLEQLPYQGSAFDEGFFMFNDPMKDLFRPRDEHLEVPVVCELNQEGYYGIQRGDIYYIEFLYQIHVIPDTRPSVLRVLIVPALDESMTSSLLPDFFDCEQGSPLTTIQAIGWKPADQLIKSGLTCDPDLTIPNLDCFVVKGMLTVHAIGSNERIVTRRILSSVQSNIVNMTTPVVPQLDYIGTNLFDLVPSLYEDTIDVPMPPPLAPPPSSSSTLFPTRILDTAEPSVGSMPTPTFPPSPTISTAPITPSIPTTTPTAIEPSALARPTTAPFVPTIVPATAVPTNNPNVRLSRMPSLTTSPTETEKLPTGEPARSNTPSTTTMPSGLSSLAPTRSVETEESSRGLGSIEWWGWLLLALGVALFVLLTLALVGLNEFYSERKLRSVRPESTSSSSGGVLTKMEQARQEYIPPGLKTNHGLIPSTR